MISPCEVHGSIRESPTSAFDSLPKIAEGIEIFEKPSFVGGFALIFEMADVYSVENAFLIHERLKRRHGKSLAVAVGDRDRSVNQRLGTLPGGCLLRKPLRLRR